MLSVSKKYLCILSVSFTFFVSNQGFSQKDNFVTPDSLLNNTYDQLDRKFNFSFNTETIKAKLYANSYIQKGIKDNNNIARAWGNYMLAMLYKDIEKDALLYLDRAINVSKNEDDFSFPAFLYINKGALFSAKGNFKEALDNYIIANAYAEKSENNYQIYILKHNIALIKRKLGKYDEAIALLNECLEHEETKQNKTKDDFRSYLLTLSELITTYRYSQKNDTASILNKKAISLSYDKELDFLFQVNKGIFQYQDKNYNEALSLLESALPHFDMPENKYSFESYNLVDTYLYISKTYRALSNDKMATFFYKKTDSILQLSGYKIPENIEVYSDIVEYYKSIGDTENQLVYINRLLSFDSILDKDFDVISEKIIKDFDTPKLIEEKEKLIEEIHAKNDSYKGVITLLARALGIVLIISITLLIYYTRKRRLDKQKFDLFMEMSENKNKVSEENQIKQKNKTVTLSDTGLSEDILSKISEKLEKFEKNQEYIELNITTNNLAKKFETNTKYLSKSIQHLKDKSFIHYINDLRIKYAIERIRTEKKFRRYTIKSMATESGFSNAQSFSTHFRKKTGVYPSFFIKEIENS